MKKMILALFLWPFIVISQPSIVLIVADDMGNGEISFNNALMDTPNIDSLAGNGAYFTQAYSQPMCTPSRVAIMTGQYAWKQSWGRSVVWPWRNNYMELEKSLLPDMLRSEGYTTAIIGKWHLGHIYPEYHPNNRGWDYFYGNMGGSLDYNSHFYNATAYGNDIQENGRKVDTSGYYTRLLSGKAVDFINQQARCPDLCPFFLYVPFTAPHTPLQAPAETIALAPGAYTQDQKTKWAMIKEMDDAIGNIIQALEDNGIRDSTIIIFTSDNGATMLGGIWDNSYGDNTPYQGEKAGLYEGGVRVPLIWNWPGVIESQVVDSAVHFIDFLPTFFEGVLGLDLPSSQSFDGVDYYGLMFGGSIEERDLILNVIPGRAWAVVRGKWKLVNNPDVDNIDTTSVSEDIRLYDVRGDKGETTDLSGSYPSLVSSMQLSIDTAITQYEDNQVLSNSTAPTGWNKIEQCGTKRTFWNDSTYLYSRNE